MAKTSKKKKKKAAPRRKAPAKRTRAAAKPKPAKRRPARRRPAPADDEPAPKLSADAAPWPKTPGNESHTRRLFREALALLIFAASIYLFLSLSAGKSLCGPIGEDLRTFFVNLTGLPASYLLTGLLFTLGVFNLMDKPLSLSWLSSSGTVVSVVALATLVAIPPLEWVPVRDEFNRVIGSALTGPAQDSAVTNGGKIGFFLADFLVVNFHKFGAFLITVTLGAIALIFATDRWALRAAVHVSTSLMRFLFSPEPAAETGGDATTRIAGEDDGALLASGEHEWPGEPAEPRRRPPTSRPRKVVVAMSADIPDEPEEGEFEEQAVERAPAPKKAPRKKVGSAQPKAAPAPEPEAKPKPEPVIRSAPPMPEVTMAPTNGQGDTKSDAPIKPPELRHFAGLPADSNYVFPSLDLLDSPERVDNEKEQAAIRKRAGVLVQSLKDFRISAEVVEIEKGPVITMYELELAPGTKVKQIANLADDLAVALKAASVRIVAPIPNKSTIGVELPNLIREPVCLKDLVMHPNFNKSKAALPLLLGKDGGGHALIEDLAQMPHLLVAGATGAGKSVCLNTIILSILLSRRPEECQMILIDPKMVELSQFRKIPHLMTPVVTDMRRAPGILEWACERMDDRYSLLHDAGVRHLVSYNKLSTEDRAERLQESGRDPAAAPPYLPYIVIVVDEMADLMMTNAKDTESHIIRLAQKSRAVGIHLIMATQRPSADVITGLIKANMPTRIAFKVSSRTDSRIVIDTNGAEKLLGMGDMLYLPPRSPVIKRCQGTYVSDEEIRRLVKHVNKVAQPQFDDDLGTMSPKKKKKDFSDDLYEDAVRTVLETGRGSTSLLQRKFSIGYTRAARLVDIMAQDGIIGKYKGSQAREVLVSLEEWEKTLAK